MTTPIQKSESDPERQRAARFKQKQKSKELPGNRYTAEQLRLLSEAVGPITLTDEEPEIMRLD